MEYYTYKAECVRVIDGDTCEISVDLGFNIFVKEKIRIMGINTAEIYGVKKGSEEYNKGLKSKQRLEELIVDKDLIIKTHRDKKGKYGRYLAEVYVEDESVGEILIKEGLAEPYPKK